MLLTAHPSEFVHSIPTRQQIAFFDRKFRSTARDYFGSCSLEVLANRILNIHQKLLPRVTHAGSQR